MRYYILLYYIVILHSMISYHITLYHMISHDIALHSHQEIISAVSKKDFQGRRYDIIE